MALLLGIFTHDNITAATGSVHQSCGGTVTDVLGVAGSDVFAVAARALDEAKIFRIYGLGIFTNDKRLMKFLTPPITVKPTGTVKVWSPFFREKVEVPTGGDPNQWALLYNLFLFQTWRVRPADKLPGTEAILHEYRQSDYYQTATRRSIPGCCVRLHEGIWTEA